jgi:hypothetical protein
MYLIVFAILCHAWKVDVFGLLSHRDGCLLGRIESIFDTGRSPYQVSAW